MRRHERHSPLGLAHLARLSFHRRVAERRTHRRLAVCVLRMLRLMSGITVGVCYPLPSATGVRIAGNLPPVPLVVPPRWILFARPGRLEKTRRYDDKSTFAHYPSARQTCAQSPVRGTYRAHCRPWRTPKR
ncbi:hypothetical protein PLICRDRAFT_313610 [Plicaturopsis crispa FD-325 SS-3]|nr:hypothetical protein PLICRDRAFT_313610 [Plicaturopsis crispa FD-325 SS-3]